MAWKPPLGMFGISADILRIAAKNLVLVRFLEKSGEMHFSSPARHI